MNKTFLVAASTLLLALPSLAQGPSIIKPQGTPVFKPQPVPQLDPASPLAMSIALDKMNKALEALSAENADLKKRLADVEKQSAQAAKDMVSVRLLLPAMDKALGTTNSKIADLRAEYLKHTHKIGFSYESFAFLNDTPGSNKGNFYIPYVWLNSKPGLSQIEKQQSVQPFLNKTTPPVAP